MSENKLQFLTRMMNDPSVRQRLKNAEERRAYCEEEWAKQEDDPEALAEAMPEAAAGEPEPEPEPDQAEVDEPDQEEEVSPGEDEVDDDQADQAEQ